MDVNRLDALSRVVAGDLSRRGLPGLLLALGSGAAGLTGEAARKRRRGDKRHGDDVSAQGPCGNGSGKANRCQKNGQCCTGLCNKKKKRCRCRKPGQRCHEDRNCCPSRTGVSCQDGACQAAAACDVCPSGCPFSALQAAVDAAASGDTIRICAGAYLGANAVADIDKDLTIIGAGDDADPAANTILDAEELNSVLRVRPSRAVTLQGLRITGGLETIFSLGGGISSEGDLSMTGCTVTGNSGSRIVGGPGGINSRGPLTMTDCTVSANTSLIGNAGGIRAFGTLRLTRCTISGNEGFVGGIGTEADTATIADSMITGNHANTEAAANGGGIQVDIGALTLIRSSVHDNTAVFLGGGISNLNGTVTLTDSSVSGNSPDNCGGPGTGVYIDPDGGCAAP